MYQKCHYFILTFIPSSPGAPCWRKRIEIKIKTGEREVCHCLKCLCATQFSFSMLSKVKMHKGVESEGAVDEMPTKLSYHQSYSTCT